MVVGLGAVTTTFIAGVEAVRRGLAKPIGSLTQMGTIRLGKRTDGRSPLVKEFIPLAGLDDIVFTGWDIFEDNVYESAAHAKVLEKDTLLELKPYLESVKPLPAVFDQYYVKQQTARTSRRAPASATSPISSLPISVSSRRRSIASWSSGAARLRSSSSPVRCINPLKPSRRVSIPTTSESRPPRSTPMPRSVRRCPIRQRRSQSHRRHSGHD